MADGGGTDHFNFAATGYNQTIDLTVTTADMTSATQSSVYGWTNNVSLAVGTIIENATGGSGSDTIIGNQYANVLSGRLGNDIIRAGAGMIPATLMVEMMLSTVVLVRIV